MPQFLSREGYNIFFPRRLVTDCTYPRCRNIGDSGKFQLYELDHESKMRLLEKSLPHLYMSGYGARNTRRKAVERNADPTTRQTSPIKKLPRAAGVAGGGRKGSTTFRIQQVWRRGVGKALRQTNHEKSAMARRAFVDMEGNTGANAREKSCGKLPAQRSSPARYLCQTERRSKRAASSSHGLIYSTGVSFNLPCFCTCDSSRWASVKIRPRKACNYPSLRSFRWVSYNKVDF